MRGLRLFQKGHTPRGERKMRRTFAVGRLTPTSAELVVMGDEAEGPFPCPLALRALVRARRTLRSA